MPMGNKPGRLVLLFGSKRGGGDLVLAQDVILDDDVLVSLRMVHSDSFISARGLKCKKFRLWELFRWQGDIVFTHFLTIFLAPLAPVSNNRTWFLQGVEGKILFGVFFPYVLFVAKLICKLMRVKIIVVTDKVAREHGLTAYEKQLPSYVKTMLDQVPQGCVNYSILRVGFILRREKGKNFTLTKQVAALLSEHVSVSILCQEPVAGLSADFFDGRQKEEVDAFYDSSDVFCLLSEDESIGLTVVEALANRSFPLCFESFGITENILFPFHLNRLDSPQDMVVQIRTLLRKIEGSWNQELINGTLTLRKKV